MSQQFRMRDFTADERRRAFDMAKREVGVQHVSDEDLTALALFLMSAIASQCVVLVYKQRGSQAGAPPAAADPVPTDFTV